MGAEAELKLNISALNELRDVMINLGFIMCLVMGPLLFSNGSYFRSGAASVAGAGIGAGFPGLQLGFGAGAGCGIGIGFGYGFGKGVAYDERGRYSNIRRPFQNSRSIAYDDQFDVMFDELMESTRKLIKATSKEIDKWRRM